MLEPEEIVLHFYEAGKEPGSLVPTGSNGTAGWPASLAMSAPAAEEPLSAQDWLDWASAVG